MSLKVQASFAAGELDPALRERTTLDKYDSGLATARNVVIGKTGRIISKPGRKLFKKCKLSGRRVVIHTMSHNGSFLEWGHLYVRVYSIDGDGSTNPPGTLIGEYAHAFTEADLDILQFTDIDFSTVMIHKLGAASLVLVVSSGGGFITTFFDLPSPPSAKLAGTANNGTSYLVDYAVTLVKNGQESLPFFLTSDFGGQAFKLSNTVTNFNVLTIQVGTNLTTGITEMKVYRRPLNGGTFGYVGSTSFIAIVGLTLAATFKDIGSASDYTHSPITLADTAYSRGLSGAAAFQATTGTIYQQRLILNFGDRIEASRTGFPGNFYRDYPLGADSALSFKSGSKGYAYVMRFLEHDGLLIFTREGVFLHSGSLTPTNLSIQQKGGFIIDELVPPISVPGGVLFIDSLTNTVRQLLYSNEANGYIGEEVSIFSDHLFAGNKILSWAFEDGSIPLLWVVFSNGTYAAFTYERDHLMRAWTRCDCGIDIEYVASTKTGINQIGSVAFDSSFSLGTVFFVTEKNGDRYIEQGVPRYVSADIAAENPESDKNESCAAMDAMVSWSSLLNSLLIDDNLTLTPVVANDWEGLLTLACVNDAIFTIGGPGILGTVFRFFNPEDRTSVDLTVTARANNNSVTVKPNCEFPSAYALNPRLYQTSSIFTGLDHLNGEAVSIIVDGYVVASPNNNVQNYPVVTANAGQIVLPNGLKGAIVHIGRPYTMDVETLDVATVEQRPILIESKTGNKVYVKVHRSRGLYVGNSFPANDKVNGMQELDSFVINYEDPIPIIGNRHDEPATKRVDITIPGDWKSNGRVCLRQVDPLHFEILSVIPDLEDLRRGK